MGRFVNPDNSAFQFALNSRIYVDKTDIVSMHDGERDEEGPPQPHRHRPARHLWPRPYRR